MKTYQGRGVGLRIETPEGVYVAELTTCDITHDARPYEARSYEGRSYNELAPPLFPPPRMTVSGRADRLTRIRPARVASDVDSLLKLARRFRLAKEGREDEP